MIKACVGSQSRWPFSPLSLLKVTHTSRLDAVGAKWP